MVPTQNPKLEFSDIFNILTAYADLSMSLEEERIALGISEIDLDEFLEDFDKKNSAERVAQSK
jgi:hypothetical protein